MEKRVRRVKDEMSVIMNDQNQTERRDFIEEMDAFLYTLDRGISNREMEALLKEKNQQVYFKVY